MEAQPQFTAPSDAENNHKSNSTLIEQDNITHSPFKMVKTEKGYTITMGKYRLIDHCKTEQEAFTRLQVERWDVIFHMIMIINEQIKELESTNVQNYKTPE